MNKKPYLRRPVVTSAKKRPRRLLRRFSRLHPVLIPVLTFGVLLALTLGGYVAFSHTHVAARDSRVVILSYDHKEQIVPSREPTVGAVLKKLHITLGQGDVVEPSAETPIEQDEFHINVYRASPVVVVDGSQKKFTVSAATTPRSIATQTGTVVEPEDELRTIPTRNFLEDGAIGQRVVIQRAKPVKLSLYGTSFELRTQSKTVGELMEERGIMLTKNDVLKPAAATPIAAGQQIYVVRKGTKLINVTRKIPMPVKTVQDPKLSYGTSAVRQQGSPGREVVTYQVTTKNGKEIKRTAIQRVVTQKPVTQIVAKGSARLSGGLGEWLRKLRQCESGGNYQTNTGNGFYGAYQFTQGTWDTLNTGYDRADHAPPNVQDQAIITNTLRSSGGLASQNPGCYNSQGLSAFPPP